MPTRVTMVYPSMRAGSLARAQRIAKSLVTSGFLVKVIGWNRSLSPVGWKSANGVRVVTFDLPNHGRSVLGLTIPYLLWWTFLFVKLVVDDAEIIHVESFFGLPPVLAINWLKRRIIVYDLIDFVADSFAWRTPIRRFLAWLENTSLGFTDGVVVMDLEKQE